MRVKFILIGYGWRADFFYRLSKIMPEQFEIVSWVVRTEERAKQVAAERKVYTVNKLEDALQKEHDFVVLCVPRGIVQQYLVKLMKNRGKVLCETPPAKNTEELRELWEAKKEYNGKVQVIEQYFLQPYYAAIEAIISQGLIGEVNHVMLSALHGYHAVSMFRRILGVKFGNCEIKINKFPYSMVNTNNREGFDYTGSIVQSDREWGYLKFENKKVAFIDFSGEQYFSMIRSRRWNIQGTRGEINDMEVRFLSEKNIPVTQQIQRLDVGINNNSEWSHKRITCLDQEIYFNPFYPARLNDDEIAVASCLTKMKEYVNSGKNFYPLREALQDTYISFLMEEAAESGKTVYSATQAWACE